MKYLFFDIECSNCFNGVGKMCEFGYILTDENFNILKQDDIPMSPGRGRDSRFYLKGRKDERDVELAYDYDFYFQQPEFPKFYERIKKLMTDSDTICFAYSMENDILHLYNSCKRYKKEQIVYKCFDIQRFAENYLNIKDQIGLKKACLSIVGPNTAVSFSEHLSRDDAKIAMKIFEAICALEQLSSNDYLNKHSYLGHINTEIITSHGQKKRQKELAKEGHVIYNSLKLVDEEACKEEYNGRRYDVSSKLKTASAIEVIKKYVEAHDGVLIGKTEIAEYFIVLDENNKQEMIQKVGGRFKGKYILFEELF